MFKRWVGLWTVCLLMCVLLPVRAGDRVLTINSGADSTTWFISGEPSLVMNGFDLGSQGIALPALINRVSISVASAVAAPIDLVIYEDANGGSPVDARLLLRTQVTITQAGVFTAVLPTPVTVTQRAVWIGFYLPVDFRFLADRSGTSVLTYWAWTPGGTFDLANLSSAQVFGPADGSAPVNINMNGRARITAELVTGGTGITGTSSQLADVITGDPAVLASLPLCSNLFYDTADEFVTYEDRVNVHCNTVASFQAPPAPAGYQQRGLLYDVYFFKQDGFIANGRLSYALTHCIRPDGADIDRAVVGLAYGSPRQWRILPTARFGDLVCSEVQYGGSLSYFVPF